MRYLSMFSGIEAATVAWHPLGWEPVAFAEIEKFPSAVLAHHYPGVPNLGDVTKVDWDEFKRTNGPIDLIVFGSPCQSFSIAGRRLGLGDPRGNLALYALQVVNKLRPKWFLFENVPGLLSSDEGRDFGAFLGTVGECGYQCAWRILDAQFFGVPQRRRRLFVVGHLGDWRPAAAVLFERESLRGHPAPRREAGEGVAERAKDGPGDGSWPALTAPTLNAAFGDKQGLEDQHALSGAGLFVPDYVNSLTANNGQRNEASDILNGSVVEVRPIAFDSRQDTVSSTQRFGALGSSSPQAQAVASEMAVRRLTPKECERLQGFPDSYSAIPWRGKPAEKCPDGPRYKALGNSMAVPCMAWIGERIQTVDTLLKETA